MPLVAKSQSKLFWNGVLKICENRLARWNSQYLSLEGKLVMANSVLDALPTYLMSLFPLPSCVDERLDSL